MNLGAIIAVQSAMQTAVRAIFLNSQNDSLKKDKDSNEIPPYTGNPKNYEEIVEHYEKYL